MKTGGQGDLDTVMERIGYRFVDPALLDRALTHASAAGPARPDNERLEFLGDRVLGLCVAEALMARHSSAAEGELSQRLHALVSRESCAAAARRVGLGPALRLARSEALTGGRKKDALLADGFEAVIAAVYLDGGLAAARTLVARLLGAELESQQAAPQNPKTALQEWAQGRGLPTPDYVEVARTGPDHAPHFVVRAALSDGRAAEAEAPSKRAAEREAAATLLTQLQEREPE